MAITVNSTPSFLASQAGCNAEIKLSSDSIFLTAGTYYTIQYLFLDFAIAAGETFILGGHTFTFVSSTPVNGFEIELSATPLTFAENIAEALNNYVWGFTAYGVDFFGNPVVGIIANDIGDAEDLGLVDNTGGAIFLLSEVAGTDAEVNEGCILQYESYIDNCLIYAGSVPFIPTRDIGCDEAASLLNLDLTFIIAATKVLYSQRQGGSLVAGAPDGTRLDTNRYKIIKVRVRECCGGDTGAWTLVDDVPVLFSSCDCLELPVTDMTPKTQTSLTPTQWLNFFKTTNEVYHGTVYQICCLIPDDEDFEVELETPLIGAISTSGFSPSSGGVLCLDVVQLIEDTFPAITNNAEVTLTLKGTLSGGSSFLAETLTFTYKKTSQCCTAIQFLNCWGTYQTIYLGKERGYGIEVESSTYLRATSGVNYTRDFARKSLNRRTFWTKDFRNKAADKRLLDAFVSSYAHTFLNETDSSDWGVEVGEYSYETETGGIQIPIVFFRRKRGNSLINYNH